MFSIQVQAETLGELASKLELVANTLKGGGVPIKTELAEEAPITTTEPKKRGRGKAKATEVEVTAQTEVTELASDLTSMEVTEAAPEVTKEKVLELLQQVSKAKSFAVAQGILKKHGGNRVSDIPKDKWAAIVDDCAANLA